MNSPRAYFTLYMVVETSSYRAITATRNTNVHINAFKRAYRGKKHVAKHQKSTNMCKNDVKLCTLPDVLQDIVLQFAFNMPKHQVLSSLGTVLDILDMELPFFFFRDKIWSWHYNIFLPNPVFNFMPIEYYNGRFCELFDDDAMYCLLLGLDFRRKNVRMFGSTKVARSYCNFLAMCRAACRIFPNVTQNTDSYHEEAGPLGSYVCMITFQR